MLSQISSLPLGPLTGAPFRPPRVAISVLQLMIQALVYLSLRMSHVPWRCLRNSVFDALETGIYTPYWRQTRKLIQLLGIYFSLAASMVHMLVRIAKPRSQWIGIATVQINTTSEPADSQSVSCTIFVPVSGEHGTDNNPYVRVRHVAPGLFIYRPDESITYPNAYRLVSDVPNYIKVCT